MPVLGPATLTATVVVNWYLVVTLGGSRGRALPAGGGGGGGGGAPPPNHCGEGAGQGGGEEATMGL